MHHESYEDYISYKDGAVILFTGFQNSKTYIFAKTMAIRRHNFVFVCIKC